MIEDWQRGNIPYFTQPPKNEEEEKWENKFIENEDPDVKNPLLEVAETAGTKLTEAQNEIIAGISKLRDQNNLHNLMDTEEE